MNKFGFQDSERETVDKDRQRMLSGLEQMAAAADTPFEGSLNIDFLETM